MWDNITAIFDGNFMPHGHCFLWTPDILWLHVVSDLVIALAYYSIPLALWFFVRHKRDFIFNWIVLMFAGFIFFCGTTHLLDIWNIWHGHYRLEGWVKAGTALISLLTAFVLWPLIPKALSMPSPKTLEEMNKELRQQILEREQIEEKLRSLNAELEERINQRTEALNRSNKDLEQFAYVASHDLQQPIRTITSMIGLLEKKTQGVFQGDTAEYFNFVKEAAKKMGDLIKNLLEYSRVGSRQAKTHMLDAGEVLHVVLQNLQATVQETGVRIETSPLPKIFYDASHLMQLMQNLIQNAIKYRSKKDPFVSISAQQSGNEWVFAIKDNGIGILDEFHAAVFDMFRRLHSEAQYPGTGIGLSICKKIVESHGGKIWVESAPDQGSTFFFTVPIKAEISGAQ